MKYTPFYRLGCVCDDVTYVDDKKKTVYISYIPKKASIFGIDVKRNGQVCKTNGVYFMYIKRK